MIYEHESVSMLDENADTQARDSNSAAADESTETLHSDYRASLLERARMLIAVGLLCGCAGYLLACLLR